MRLIHTMVTVVLCAHAIGAQTLQGTVHQESFFGTQSDTTIYYNIYLPPGYAQSTGRYPVVYHLHGLGGNQGGPQNTLVPASFESAYDAGVLSTPMIVVFPNGMGGTMFADSWNGSTPAETSIIQDLVPHIDAEYRTIAHRGTRVIQGFSMGGYGAAEYAAKFPGLFGICVSYDGALHTWATLTANRADIASGIFNDDETYFNAYSPYTNLRLNRDEFVQSVALRVLVGDLVEYNRNYKALLDSLAVPVDYVETTCAHNLSCLLNEEGRNSAAFIAGHLDLSGVAVRTGAPAARTPQSSHSPSRGLVDCQGRTVRATVAGIMIAPGRIFVQCRVAAGYTGEQRLWKAAGQ